MLETLTGTKHHRLQGVVGDHNKDPCLSRHESIQAVQQGPSPGEHDPLAHDVGR